MDDIVARLTESMASYEKPLADYVSASPDWQLLRDARAEIKRLRYGDATAKARIAQLEAEIERLRAGYEKLIADWDAEN